MVEEQETPKEEEVVETPAETVEETVEDVVEEAPEEPAEEEAEAEEAPAEEPAEEAETPAEDAPAEEEEKPAEEPAEEPVEEAAPVEDEKEALSKDIEATKEELAVVKEVREELVSLYGRYQDSTKSVERLSVDNTKLTEENASLAEQLLKYVEAEATFNAKIRAERLDALSNKFTLLGQEKIPEQLGAMDDNTLAEFETIVDAALNKAGESKEALSETEPSNVTVEESASESKDEPEPAKEEEKKEALNKKDFFAGLCGELTKEQTGLSRSARHM